MPFVVGVWVEIALRARPEKLQTGGFGNEKVLQDDLLSGAGDDI